MNNQITNSNVNVNDNSNWIVTKRPRVHNSNSPPSLNLDMMETPEELLVSSNNEDEDKNDNEDYNDNEDNDKTDKKLQEPNKKNITEQKQFEDMVTLYFNSGGYHTDGITFHELEVRFGTRGIKPLNKTDYNNVIKKLKSLGFWSNNEVGTSTLKIQSEYIDKHTGRFKLSDIRVEINSLNAIQTYCKTNSIKEIMKINDGLINFTNKKAVIIDDKKLFPVNFDDFNFRVSYQTESSVSHGLKHYVVLNWEKNKKTFRYLNRVTFRHRDYPIIVDLSIVKSSTNNIRTYTVSESNVFDNKEQIEIELEVLNHI
jgi:hypothetical protein